MCTLVAHPLIWNKQTFLIPQASIISRYNWSCSTKLSVLNWRHWRQKRVFYWYDCHNWCHHLTHPQYWPFIPSRETYPGDSYNSLEHYKNQVASTTPQKLNTQDSLSASQLKVMKPLNDRWNIKYLEPRSPVALYQPSMTWLTENLQRRWDNLSFFFFFNIIKDSLNDGCPYIVSAPLSVRVCMCVFAWVTKWMLLVVIQD